MRLVNFHPKQNIQEIVKDIVIIENPLAFEVVYFPLGYPFINVVTSDKIMLKKNQIVLETHSYLCGQATTNYKMKLPTIDRFLLIQFHPWSLRNLFQFSPHDFFDNQIELELIDSNLANHLEDIVSSHLSSEEVLDAVQDLLLTRLKRNCIDDRIINSWTMIFDDFGQSKIKALSETSNISTRRLEQLFLETIGATPKQYCKIARFQNVVFHLIEGRDCRHIPDQYYDQSHFINDIKTLSGMTPRNLNEHLKEDINRFSAANANLYYSYDKSIWYANQKLEVAL